MSSLINFVSAFLAYILSSGSMLNVGIANPLAYLCGICGEVGRNILCLRIRW